MKIQFNSIKSIVVIEEQKKDFNEVEVLQIMDRPTKKEVVAFVKGMLNPITLWQGSEYDSIGQWTDNDVINRIKELFK